MEKFSWKGRCYSVFWAWLKSEAELLGLALWEAWSRSGVAGETSSRKKQSRLEAGL